MMGNGVESLRMVGNCEEWCGMVWTGVESFRMVWNGVEWVEN